MPKLDFYAGKRVLVTGHTGFKGSWLCRILILHGAVVTGYSLEPPTTPNLFSMAGIADKMHSVIGDIRDYEKLKGVFEDFQPEIVFHLAAQPIVKESYVNPRETYEINVMGTVNLMECVRLSDCVKSVVNVTTDKVYENKEWCWGYREDEPLDGYDPYSNSKSCSELVTHSYKKSFFEDKAISTVRAGNVLGGGDFAKDRIIPDCIRAVEKGETIQVRNPYSVRPYQHVLEPLMVYLELAMGQYRDPALQGYYNVGPDECDCICTGQLVDLFCKSWGQGAGWEAKVESGAPHEANYLKLDCSKLKTTLGWKPKWHIEKCIRQVCRFSRIWMEQGDIPAEMDREIREFLKE